MMPKFLPTYGSQGINADFDYQILASRQSMRRICRTSLYEKKMTLFWFICHISNTSVNSQLIGFQQNA